MLAAMLLTVVQKGAVQNEREETSRQSPAHDPYFAGVVEMRTFLESTGLV